MCVNETEDFEGAAFLGNTSTNSSLTISAFGTAGVSLTVSVCSFWSTSERQYLQIAKTTGIWAKLYCFDSPSATKNNLIRSRTLESVVFCASALNFSSCVLSKSESDFSIESFRSEEHTSDSSHGYISYAVF